MSSEMSGARKSTGKLYDSSALERITIFYPDCLCVVVSVIFTLTTVVFTLRTDCLKFNKA